MKYGPLKIVNMWHFLHTKMMLDMYHQPFDMINSPFAYPRLPTRSNPPLGINNAGKIKDMIVNDNNAMMGRLFDYHEMYQRYASGLFNFSSDRFIPGHPMSTKVQVIDTLQKENDKLRKENLALKTTQTKEKKINPNL